MTSRSIDLSRARESAPAGEHPRLALRRHADLDSGVAPPPLSREGALILSGDPMMGTADRDFMFGYEPASALHNTMLGLGGDDFAIGDIANFHQVTRGVRNFSTSNAVNLDSLAAAWTVGPNSLVQTSSVPHALAYVEGTNDEPEVFSIALTAGQTVTLDVDLAAEIGGLGSDLVIKLYRDLSVLVASNDDAATTLGGLGSQESRDPYLQFTADADGVYHIVITESPNGGPDTLFDGDEAFLLNVSVTGHAVSAPARQGRDTIEGGEGNDYLLGGGNDDEIRSGGGDDTISGDGGDDALFGDEDSVDNNTLILGGAGSDTIYSSGDGTMLGDAGDDYIRNATTDVFELADGGSGNDTLDAANYDGGYAINLATGATNFTNELFRRFENLLTGDGADTISGTNGGNYFGAAGGHDFIRGRGGDDIIDGGSGADTLNGGDGSDWASYLSVQSAIVASLRAPGSNTAAASGDRYISIENLGGTDDHDGLTGDELDNRINGESGDDTIRGDAGNDTLSGGIDGNDRLIGGAGDDQFALGSPFAALDKAVIVDFSGDDEIALIGDVLGLTPGALDPSQFALGSAAGDGDDRVIYDPDNGKLWFDVDGAGGQAKYLLATLLGAPTLGAADLVVI